MSPSPRWLFLVLSTAATVAPSVAFATPSTVEAQVCPCPELMDVAVFPLDQSVDVPTNARIWVRADWLESPADVRLTDHREHEVELTPTSLRVVDDPNAPVVHSFATSGLEAGGNYTVWIGDTVASEFWVGAQPDATPPTLPYVIGRDRTSNHSGTAMCPGPTHLATFQVDHEPGLLVVDRDGTAALLADAPEGVVTTLSARQHVSIGRSPCVDNWPQAEPAARTRVRFGAYDLAGNFSGWSEYEDVLIQPEHEALACRTVATPVPWVGLGAFAMVLFGLRRRAG